MRKEVLIIYSFMLAIVANQKLSSRSPRIVGGRFVEISSAPWYATIFLSLLENDNFMEKICGGSIVSSSVILTAAHCISAPKIYNITVRVGSNVFNSGGKVIEAFAMAIHPKFKLHMVDFGSDADFDIGIIWLNADIIFSDTIQSIPLLDINQTISENSEGIICGIGSKYMGASVPSKLRCVNLIAGQREICMRIHEPKADALNNSNTICAGNGIQNICLGDSGSGLIIHGKLAGVASRSLCGLFNTASISTSLTTLKTWTQEISSNFTSYLDIIDFIYKNFLNVQFLKVKKFSLACQLLVTYLMKLFP